MAETGHPVSRFMKAGRFTLTLSTTVSAIDGCGGEWPLTGSRPGPYVGAGVVAPAAWALEGKVEGGEIGQFRIASGGHCEGQFEGKMVLACACLSLSQLA
jgi:hypothetical protein